ncbi:MAG: hypothetical protein HYZ18_04245 [Pseudogulbenkiania sp.]|nr:hypothetical protein [Pseudogulbenkiania sp.]
MAAVPPTNPRSSTRTFASIDISTNASGVSDLVDITGLTLSAISMSTAWTDAKIGLKCSVDGTTNVQDVYTTDGNFLTYSTSANRLLVFDPLVFAGVQKLQLVSETSAGVAVAQAATRTIKLSLAKVVD